jgi:hypothetical protein
LTTAFTKYRLVQAASAVRRVDTNLIQWDIAVHSVAKTDSNHPYLVANEFIAFRLGELLGLPVVHGVALTGLPESNRRDGKPEELYWSSLSVGEDLPDGLAKLVWSGNPSMAAGAIAFDAWIANPDRYARNFTYDEESNELLLFDHADCLCNRFGPSYLRTRRRKLGFESVNAIANEATSLTQVVPWVAKIQAIPAEAIRSIVQVAQELGLAPQHVEELTTELVFRQKHLMYMLSANRADFPRLEPSFLIENTMQGEPQALYYDEVYDDSEAIYYI